jgi:hypothetical protein
MNKKVFTLLLVAVFALAQFSIGSAATINDAVITVDPLPTFSSPTSTGELKFTMELPGGPNQNVLVWWRYDSADPWTAAMCSDMPGNVNDLTFAAGSYPYDMSLYVPPFVDQDVLEFLVTVVDAGSCGDVLNLPAADTPAMASSFVDGNAPDVLQGFPPSVELIIPPANPVVCNTFEYWALASDNYGLPASFGYSGFGGWNQSVTGTIAPPAPEGPDNALLSWVYTFPATASGIWTFTIAPEDVVGNPASYLNGWGGNFRVAAPAVSADELEDCKNFSDALGANETYIRYLADLGLISGFVDGTYGPDNTLTRAEASTLFEKANGWADETGLPTSPPSAACTFTDVSASDWFAGWVWQACADGFMNGIGGGLFDPNNLLTRGQIVTVMNNIAINLPVGWTFLTYFESPVLINDWWGNPNVLRTTAWTDVAIGAFYATPVIQAYGWGVAEGTSATTFSPDSPTTRGEFAKMLYRALSRTE